MGGPEESDDVRGNGGMPRRRSAGAADPDGHRGHEAGDDELDAVNRLLGFLRDGDC
jgi:hypothetical protein